MKDNEKVTEKIGKYLQVLKSENSPLLSSNFVVLEKTLKILNIIRSSIIILCLRVLIIFFVLVFNADKINPAARKEATAEISSIYQSVFNFSEEKEIQAYYEDFTALENDKQSSDFKIELKDANDAVFYAHKPIMVF